MFFKKILEGIIGHPFFFLGLHPEFDSGLNFFNPEALSTPKDLKHQPEFLQGASNQQY
jgi:hypothetical protein